MALARWHAGPQHRIALCATILVSPLRRGFPGCHFRAIHCLGRAGTVPTPAGIGEPEMGILLDACLRHVCSTWHQPTVMRCWHLVVEIVLGLGGYFSDFKTPLFFTLLAAMAARVRLSLGRYLALLSLGAVALMLGVAWTAVKVDYRNFVSGGEKAQIVTVGYLERIAKLTDMVSAAGRQCYGRRFGEALATLSVCGFFRCRPGYGARSAAARGWRLVVGCHQPAIHAAPLFS